MLTLHRRAKHLMSLASLGIAGAILSWLVAVVVLSAANPAFPSAPSSWVAWTNAVSMALGSGLITAVITACTLLPGLIGVCLVLWRVRQLASTVHWADPISADVSRGFRRIAISIVLCFLLSTAGPHLFAFAGSLPTPPVSLDLNVMYLTAVSLICLRLIADIIDAAVRVAEENRGFV